jgi:hypothetical protein
MELNSQAYSITFLTRTIGDTCGPSVGSRNKDEEVHVFWLDTRFEAFQSKVCYHLHCRNCRIAKAWNICKTRSISTYQVKKALACIGGVIHALMKMNNFSSLAIVDFAD